MESNYIVCDYDTLFKYKKGDIINNNEILEYIKVKDKDGKNKSRAYLCKCLTDGYVRPVLQYKLNNNKRSCAVCDNKIVIKGINDVATTRPDLAKYIQDKSLIYKISRGSEKPINFECPVCHAVSKKNLHNVARDGFSCPKCSDGRTIPNKLMYLILEQSGLDFECEVYFDWCKFPLNFKSSKITHGIYDFVIESQKLIIEMDGGLGHGKKIYSKSNKTVEETEYRDRIKDQLAKEHGYKVIRIDCDYTEDNKYDYMSNSLRSSEISKIINISDLDLHKLFIDANDSSLVKESCVLWNQGMSLGEIGEKIKIGKHTIRKYLKIGDELGLCQYKSDSAYERGIDKYSIGDYEYSLHFNSASEFVDFIEMYNIPLNFHSIKNRFVSQNTNETIMNDIKIVRTPHKKL